MVSKLDMDYDDDFLATKFKMDKRTLQRCLTDTRRAGWARSEPTTKKTKKGKFYNERLWTLCIPISLFAEFEAFDTEEPAVKSDASGAVKSDGSTPVESTPVEEPIERKKEPPSGGSKNDSENLAANAASPITETSGEPDMPAPEKIFAKIHDELMSGRLWIESKLPSDMIPRTLEKLQGHGRRAIQLAYDDFKNKWNDENEAKTQRRIPAYDREKLSEHVNRCVAAYVEKHKDVLNKEQANV